MEDIFYLFQETTSNSVITNLEEARQMDERPENKHMGVKFNTILQEAEVVNQNRRLYTKRSLDGGLRSITEKIIKPGAFFGENSHPITDNPSRFGTILMQNACHRILEYKWEGNVLHGVGETLNNTAGRDMKGLVLQGVPIGFSLRGAGKVSANKQGGISRIEESIRPFAYDHVHNPSHANALLQNVITESCVSDFLSESSETLKILQESLSKEAGENIELVKRNSGISYNFNENVAIICGDNSCMKVMLSEQIKKDFQHNFKNLIGY